MFSKNDIPELEKRIREAIEREGADDTPGIEKLVCEVTGPNAGLIYKPQTGNLVLADGWKFDEAGNVVKA